MVHIPVHVSGPAQEPTRLEFLWREMTGAGDLLIEALRLEQEFGEVDLTQVEDDVLERWRLNRRAVERLAGYYASALSQWREALLESVGQGE